MSDTFKFTLDSAPDPYTPVEYSPNPNGFYLSVTYYKKGYNGMYPIGEISIHKSLDENTVVPFAMGAAGPRGTISSKSLQINYDHIHMSGNCKKSFGNLLPQINIGQEAVFMVNSLTEDESTDLKIESCSLIIGKIKYTVTPTRFVDNRITDATCEMEEQHGGNYRKRKATQKARRNNRRNNRRYLSRRRK